MQVQRTLRTTSINPIALVFAVVAALLLASAAGYLIGGLRLAASAPASQTVVLSHEQSPDAAERNVAVSPAATDAGADANSVPGWGFIP